MKWVKNISLLFIPLAISIGLIENGFNSFRVYTQETLRLNEIAIGKAVYDRYGSKFIRIQENEIEPAVAGASSTNVYEVQSEPELINTNKYKKVAIGSALFDCEVSLTRGDKADGLSGIDHLDKNTGMLFIFDTLDYHSFWMKDMKMPLDFVWISGNKVVQINKHIDPSHFQPPRFIMPHEPVDAVLELYAGECERNKLEVGDYVEFRF